MIPCTGAEFHAQPEAAHLGSSSGPSIQLALQLIELGWVCAMVFELVAIFRPKLILHCLTY